MPLIPDTKPCLFCGMMLRGRRDKKFCDDYCRSAYNNRMHPPRADVVRRVNAVLRKNRRILEEVIPEGAEVARVTKARLTRKGFNFQHITGAYANKEGSIYYFCYEYGYMLLEKNWFYVIRRAEIILSDTGAEPADQKPVKPKHAGNGPSNASEDESYNTSEGRSIQHE